MSPATAAPAGRRRRVLVRAGLVGLLVVGVLSLPSVRRGLLDPAGREPVTGVTTVEVRDDAWEYFAFSPPVLQVPVGTEVTWEWTSRAPHDVTFADGTTSGVLEAGASWSRTFDEPGDLAYACTLHEGMHGRIVVTR